MRYGEFLKVCRRLSKSPTAIDFAVKLGFKKPDHYRGVENDKRKPGRELLEKAAELAGMDFEDCITVSQEPAKDRAEKEMLRLFRGTDVARQKSLIALARVYVKAHPRRSED